MSSSLLLRIRETDPYGPDSNAAIPFPRLSSTSSVMSLDDTPLKDRLPSLDRRLASRSMHDLAGSAALQRDSSHGTPSRTTSLSDFANTPSISGATPSPMSVASFGRRSDSAASHRQSGSPERRPDVPSPVPSVVPFRPTPSLSPTKPSSGATRPSPDPRPVPRFDPDDLPSPFLKKADPSRFPSASSAPVAPVAAQAGKPPVPRPSLPARAVRTSLGSKPSLSSRLLAARAQSGAGVDEVGRRLLGVGGHLRGKSTSS